MAIFKEVGDVYEIPMGEVGESNAVYMRGEATLIEQDFIRGTATFSAKFYFINSNGYKNYKLIFNSPITFSYGILRDTSYGSGYPYDIVCGTEIIDLTNSNIILKKAPVHDSSSGEWTVSDYFYSTTFTFPYYEIGYNGSGIFSIDDAGIKMISGENVTEKANALATVGYQEVDETGSVTYGDPVIKTFGGCGHTFDTYSIRLVDSIIIPEKTRAYVGDNLNIRLDTRYSNPTYTLSYEIKESKGRRISDEQYTTTEYTIKNGIIIEQTPLTEIVWQIPMDVFSECNGATRVKCVLTCDVFIFSEYGDEYVVDTVTKEIEVCQKVEGIGPYFINTEGYDENKTTVALTGNEFVLVKYFSDYCVISGATLHEDAYKINTNVGGLHQTYTCGQFTKNYTWPKHHGSWANFREPESGTVDIKAVDMLGNTSYTQVNLPMIDYIKLTCELVPSIIAANGTMRVTIEGEYFDGSFGAKDNTLNLYYKFSENIHEDGNVFGSWMPVPFTIDNGKYRAEFIISDLNYQYEYYVQARAVDKLMDITTPSRHISGQSVFDWSREDFNFNVPVTHQRNITLATRELSGIMGVTPEGEELELLALKDNNILHIGFGAYNQGTGGTYIYGNDLRLISALNGEVNLSGMINALTQSYDLTTRVLINQEAADAWNAQILSANSSLTLRGNCLYCQFNVSFSAEVGAGDIDDLFAGRVFFYHDGKITGMSSVSSSTTAANFNMSNVIVNGTSAQFDMYLTNTSEAGFEYSTAFIIPVSLDLNAFVN